MCTHKFQEGKFQCGMRIGVADILDANDTESCAKREKYNFPALSCPFLNCLPRCIHQLASPRLKLMTCIHFYIKPACVLSLKHTACAITPDTANG